MPVFLQMAHAYTNMFAGAVNLFNKIKQEREWVRGLVVAPHVAG